MLSNQIKERIKKLENFKAHYDCEEARAEGELSTLEELAPEVEKLEKQIKELKEFYNRFPVSLRQVIYAGDKYINIAGLNPYCMNEGANGDDIFRFSVDF